MTKARITKIIAENLQKEPEEVLLILEEFFKTVKTSLEEGENLYIRGFGSFITKKRAKKLGRNIKEKKTVTIDAHYIPFFKPSKAFVAMIKESEHFKKILEEEEQENLNLAQSKEETNLEKKNSTKEENTKDSNS